jgi:transcription elongation factor SPT5
VRVVSGELSGITGIVEAVQGENVAMHPLNEELKSLGVIDVRVADVRKFFNTGDHVKVSGGKFDGETGLVVRVDHDGTVLTIFSDLTMKEFDVLAQDVALAADVATGKVTLAGLDLYDMVSLEGNSVGVIVKIENDGFRILDTQNTAARGESAANRPKAQSATGVVDRRAPQHCAAQ